MLDGARPSLETVKWTKSHLRARCETLRTAVEGSCATKEEVADYWPGGKENPARDYGAWAWCWGSLMRMLGRDDSPEKRQALMDTALAAAEACVAEPVPMHDGTTRYVHPKSYHALRWLDSLDRQVMLVRAEDARPLEFPEQNATSALAPLMESLCVRLWAAILTHPDPDLPFSDDEQNWEPPDWTRTMTPGDVLALASAHVKVNHKRNAIIAAAFPSSGDGQSRLTLAGFIGVIADEHGRRPFELTRRWSLGELYAQRVVAAQASKEAHEKAKRDAAA